MKHLLLILIGLLVGLLLVVGVGGFLLAHNFFTSPSPTSTTGSGSTTQGGRSMGNNGNTQMNSHAAVISPSTLQQQIQQLAPELRVDAATNQIQYTTRQVTLLIVGAPPGHPGMYWQVDGRINPTVVVPSGATVRIIFANGDSGTMHGWELTSSSPPYSAMPMMGVSVVAQNAFLMPLPAPHGNQWYTETATFSAPAPGIYYYLCPVDSHAQKGMWGKLIVQ